MSAGSLAEKWAAARLDGDAGIVSHAAANYPAAASDTPDVSVDACGRMLVCA